MSTAPDEQLRVVADVIGRFGLTSLQSTLLVCQALSGGDMPLDVAVLGQFKSGKSSLLNAVLGESVFPVGVVPVTTVITRATAGPKQEVHVTHLNGSVEEVTLPRLVEFATEAGNPGNRRQVAVVDVFTPGLSDWPGLRLVDTPGLGSVLAHNTEATRAWMPNVAVALVAISAERPLSDEDRRLVAEARAIAPRVVVLLTKVDLLTDGEQSEVMAFLDRGLREHFGASVPVLPFSCRAEPGRWVQQLKESVLLPVAGNVAGERRAALGVKLAALVRACRGYLAVGLRAAEQADTDRQRLRAAVLDESVKAAVIRDELHLVERRMCDGTRSTFEKVFLARRAAAEQRLAEALAAELRTWQGNLAQQSQRYEAWMAGRLTTELTAHSLEGAQAADGVVGEAEGRFRRVIEAFRDRLCRNIHEATGVTVSPLAWEVKRARVEVAPVAVSRAFMTHWDLLWWLLPMRLVGGLFRRHILGLVPWEVEKNLIRLAGDWSGKVNAAVADLRIQASAWVDTELATLDRLLAQQPIEAVGFRSALKMLDEEGVSQPV